MNKQIWIIANWKSNKTLAEALSWVDEVGPNLEKRENIKVVVCPTFLDLEEVKKAILVGHYPMLVGAQDLSPFDSGAYTGEEAARLLREVVDLAILGHSERRVNFQETDEMIQMKVKQALDNNITPLVCVQNQGTPVPEGTELVAYEPIFAIGTNHPDTPQDAEAVAKGLKLKTKDISILYGGSVNSQNAKAFLQQDNINGLLIGNASLDAEEFIKTVQVSYLI